MVSIYSTILTATIVVMSAAMDQKTPGLLLEEELKCGLVPILQLRAHLDPLASESRDTPRPQSVSPLWKCIGL